MAPDPSYIASSSKLTPAFGDEIIVLRQTNDVGGGSPVALQRMVTGTPTRKKSIGRTVTCTGAGDEKNGRTVR